MYDLQAIAIRIKQQAKAKKISMREMLSACNLGINAISEMAKGKAMSSLALAGIADYLDCSVDYLLGRSDSPEKTAPGTLGADEVDEEFIDEFSVRYFSLTPESRKVILELMDRLLDGQEK